MKLREKVNKYLIIQTVVIVLMLLFRKDDTIFRSIIMVYIGIGVTFYYKVIKCYLVLETELEKSLKSSIHQQNFVKLDTKNIELLEEIQTYIERGIEYTSTKNLAEIYDKQTELTALQSQINPHFLYNTLESIRGQALIDDNVEIAQMMSALASFFRYSISKKGSLVTVRDELNNIENYMAIQRYRFNNRFSLTVIVEEEDEEVYDYLIPRLILQPVIENAVYHGLEECLSKGEVIVEIMRTEQKLIITVSDNGKGMSKVQLREINERINRNSSQSQNVKDEVKVNTGIALPNIHKRIQLLFGEDYGIQVYSTLNQGTDVEMILPANYERDGY